MTATPETYRDLAEALGTDGADALVRAYGGDEVYVPRRHEPGHPVLAVLPGEVAARLVEYYGGDRVYVPSCGGRNRRRMIADMAEEGARRREIARAVGVTTRHVRRVLSGQYGDPRQLDLFLPPPPPTDD